MPHGSAETRSARDNSSEACFSAFSSFRTYAFHMGGEKATLADRRQPSWSGKAFTISASSNRPRLTVRRP